MWPGSSIPATAPTSRSDRCAWLCRHKRIRFLVGTAELKSCCRKKCISREFLTLPHPAVKNLAGFGRGFRFTQQKHICAAAKQKTPHGRRNPKPKTQKKIYETQPQQIRGRF